jgi:hypothetical protein
LDIIVNDQVIIEIKSVESLQDLNHKQLLTYLKLTNKKLRLLINFDIASLKYESAPKRQNFWTKVHKELIFNYPSLKAGVRQTANNQGFSPKTKPI